MVVLCAKPVGLCALNIRTQAFLLVTCGVGNLTTLLILTLHLPVQVKLVVMLVAGHARVWP